MRVLVTGSSGWLGRPLAARLRQDGHRVTGLDIAAGPETQVVGSVADRRAIERAFAFGADAVIHTAALHQPDMARARLQSFVDINVSGTLALLEAAKAAQCSAFVMTSTTSLMIDRAIREEQGEAAVWLDESHAPLNPRNIYGTTKLAAEGLVRLFAQEHGLPGVVLRTSRFFPEDDAVRGLLSGPNLKANEFLHRRLTVEDAVDVHLAALDRAATLGFGLFIASAPPPFTRDEATELKRDARAVIARHFPDAAELYAGRGWQLPRSIGRVYDPSLAQTALGWRARTDFAAVLEALRSDAPLPFAHDASYVSPKDR
ncbi:NAD-dependent epimerase/dehydratase family protein [Novosphingobium huizhouense]|uniref:NAD-dependent epimerase/dehydratase family protein n=1 Tax=Novosphingobium huizhouense TaxID=2866625 RepID=UPI001CD8C841|nr:NAD(P)-dependent oxidoreductase [Novosphingobium huizhouense]